MRRQNSPEDGVEADKVMCSSLTEKKDKKEELQQQRNSNEQNKNTV